MQAPRQHSAAAMRRPIVRIDTLRRRRVAHLTGWTLVDADGLVQVTVRLPGGFEYERYAYSYAHRNGERRSIANVADVALGLEPGHGLWIGSADTALWRLREIAGR